MYKIKRIDAVLGTDSKPIPIFFIDLDYIALDYLLVNPTKVIIRGTTLYDGEYTGVLDKSNDGNYAITIPEIWKGYPDNLNGTIEIVGLSKNAIELRTKETTNENGNESESGSRNENNSDTYTKLMICAGIGAFLIIVVIVLNKKKGSIKEDNK